MADLPQDLMKKAQIKDYSSKFDFDKDYLKAEKDQKRQDRIKNLHQDDDGNIKPPDI